jgi:hypothetical protein
MSIIINILRLHHRRIHRRQPIHTLPNQARESLRPRNTRPQSLGSELSHPKAVTKNSQKPSIVRTLAVQLFPVPPPSVYNPEKYKDKPVAKQKISQPPQQMYTLRRKSSHRILRVAQCDIAVGRQAARYGQKRQQESLSSIYSRSVSGDSPDLSLGGLLSKDQQLPT